MSGLKLLFLAIRDEFKTLLIFPSWNQNRCPIQANSYTDHQQYRVKHSCGSPPHLTAGINHNQSTDKERNQSQKIEVWRFRLEVLTVFIGLCLAIVYFRQMQANLRQAKAAEKQLKEMRASQQMDERAWVLATGDMEQSASENRETAMFQVIYKNYGKTPAINMETVIRTVRDRHQIPKNDVYPSLPEHQGICPPNEGGKIPAGELPMRVMADIADGAPVWVFGTIWYDDIFGGHHWSQFCIEAHRNLLNKNLISFRQLQIHNSCDNAETSQSE